MIFCEAYPAQLQPAEDQKFDRRMSTSSPERLLDGTLLSYIRAQYNRSTPIDPPSSRNSPAPAKSE